MEDIMPKIVSVKNFSEALDLDVILPCMEELKISVSAVSSPGLFLSGYTNNFSNNRVQVVGRAEIGYLNSLDKEVRKSRLELLFKLQIPCIIVARGIKVDKDFLDIAKKFSIVVFGTELSSTDVINKVSYYLVEILAKTTTIYGNLLDVFGIGVLLQGKSGIGKSETALELIHRGHRLVADDVVDVKNIRGKLYGSSPEIVKHFMEIRGVGVIDIAAMYGVGSVLDQKKIKLVVELEQWDNSKNYDRLGLERKKTDILGAKISTVTIPVMPGRNLAIVIEVACRDSRLRENGYIPCQEIAKKMEE